MSTKPAADPRPLSPHLQVWRFHATMLASIVNRMAGAGLYFGSVLIVAWLTALALGPEAFQWLDAIVRSIPGQIILFLWTAAALFHLSSGVRHLMWDGPGLGFSPKVASAWAVASFVFAALGAVGVFAAARLLGGI